MKKFLSLLLPISLVSIVFLAGCTSEKPLTEAEQAAKYGMTVTEYREQKIAASRMNMSFEEHIRMLKAEEGSMKHEGMDMDM